MGTTPFSLRIDENTKLSLDKIAALEDRSASYLAGKAIEAYVQEFEARSRLIAAAIKAAEKGEFISDAAMQRWLEGWGSDNELNAPGVDIRAKS
ncbi:CopG family ribbon-helix-helix protein [Robiginitomaculum antarcticum]|uniref:CopG family ribbon-helix-helix protein n=1 Tax=Robiginitomaculum antarcticum TaxID=437507 RepID=UPI00039D67CC|nr:ribbon-helix-helix domain-containing protein [Robiginitomaculum antarcticum]